ncbi:MAG: penicillin-binding protein 1C [Myxococcales bacterium]|nr:penicillin-binding protein 1C [Myxococcales bacterium]
MARSQQTRRYCPKADGVVGGAVACLLLGALCVSALDLLWDIDVPASALAPKNVQALRISDRDGTLLREVLSRPDGRANWVPLEQIARHVIDATLAGEDRRFYQHDGIDRRAVGRAFAQLLARRHVVSGASTLTMQLARLVDSAQHARRRDLWSKVRQTVLALRLERALSKDEILWQYLNRAPYGNGTFGVQAAARRYFDKPASALSLAEAALLAALPRSPRGYDPFRGGRARLVARQRFLLRRMRELGMCSDEQLRMALGEPIRYRGARRPFRAPHLARALVSVAGDDAAAIKSSIDLELQRQVQTLASQTVKRLADHGVSNAAALVVDNHSGEVLAYVGSADFGDADHAGQVDGTQALRQPGSTLKPFTYAMGIEQGLTVSTLLEDLPAHFTTPEGDYAPKNYDRRFHGPVRLAVALASSYNVPAVRVAEYVGSERLLERLRALGFENLDKTARHYGLGLTLGNGEVTLQQLAAAYVALANGGMYRPLSLVRAVRDPRGRWTKPARPKAQRVFDARAAYLITRVLSDAMARIPGFGRDTPLDVESLTGGFPAAVKTGTSKDFRDNWTVGFTRDVTVAVWVGNFDGKPMRRVSGITGAGPLWAEVIIAAQRRYDRDGHARRGFSRPRGVVERRICPHSGKLASARCEGAIDAEFITGHAPTAECDHHVDVAIDRRNGLLAGPGCAHEHVEQRVMLRFPPTYRAWAHARGIAQAPTTYSPHCPAATHVATPERKRSRERVTIRFPVQGDRYYVDPDLARRYQQLPLEASVNGDAARVRWLVDGKAIASASFPYSASWRLRRGRHTIEARLPDGSRSTPVRITVR